MIFFPPPADGSKFSKAKPKGPGSRDSRTIGSFPVICKSLTGEALIQFFFLGKRALLREVVAGRIEAFIIQAPRVIGFVSRDLKS